MNDERNTALLHLLALTQGRAADARKRSDSARWDDPAAIDFHEIAEAARLRIAYLVAFLSSRTAHRRSLP